VDSADELPDRWTADRPLAVLERGSLLQAIESFEQSARDLSAGETELELLDLKLDTVGQIGKFVYSGSAQTYETPPTERLVLNAVNMLNYLALGDFPGASIEARRFTVMREYLESLGLPDQASFGAYLAGLTFQRLGEGNRALRYYEEAMHAGVLASLRGPVARLAVGNPYRGPRIRSILDNARAESLPPNPSEIVTVLCLGRVPHKVPERMPIGLAIGLAGTWITGNPKVLARSAFKVIVYPELVSPKGALRSAVVEIGGEAVSLELLSDLGADIRREYETVRPRILGAALSRMIVRAAAAEAARHAGKQAGGSAGQVIGLLGALAVEGGLVGLDTPDTRSWTLLANRIWVARTVVPPGEHEVQVRVRGPGFTTLRRAVVRVPEGGTSVVVVTEPR
jgi:hypothetical protein